MKTATQILLTMFFALGLMATANATDASQAMQSNDADAGYGTEGTDRGGRPAGPEGTDRGGAWQDLLIQLGLISGSR